MKKTTRALYVLLVIACLCCLLSADIFSPVSLAPCAFITGPNSVVNVSHCNHNNKLVITVTRCSNSISSKINHFNYGQHCAGAALTKGNTVAYYSLISLSLADQNKTSNYLKNVGEKE